MEKFNNIYMLFLLLISSHQFLNHCGAMPKTIQSGSPAWGYVRVRPQANMFWLLYKSPYKVYNPNKPWPIILWLHGGPGASGVGIGNFLEIGPLDVNLNPRNSTWLKIADLLFVDYPVGTGYSFVEDPKLLTKTDEETIEDLTTLLIEVFNTNVYLQKNVLYIVGESYGGKLAVSLGLSSLKLIESGELKSQLGGVVLGSSWISPEDCVFSWGPVLKDLSRIDENGLEKSNSIAVQIKEKLDSGKFEEAADLYFTLQDVIRAYTNSVDLYNFLLDSNMDPLSSTASHPVLDDLYTLMNGPIKKQLYIPQNLSWARPSRLVFDSMRGDFMRPRINQVDELLLKGVDVTIYSGQVDVISTAKGTQAWVQKLNWEGLETFSSMNRTPLYCGDNKTRGFSKSYKNLHFYSILEAGHFVPMDQPCISLQMMSNIIQTTAT